MVETYKLNESGGGGRVSLLFRFLRLLIILNIIVFPIFYFRLGVGSFYLAEVTILAFSLLVFLTKREVEKIHFENGKLTIKGIWFLLLPFTTTIDYSKFKYKFNKDSLRKKKSGLFRKRSCLTLYKNNRSWVRFTGGTAGWNRAKLGRIVKTMIANGCYNWFEFDKKERKKKSS